MAFKNIIRVAEFEKLYYDDSRPFKFKHWEALCRYQEKQQKTNPIVSEYFKILNRGIQFSNYVGVIQAGNLTIEILPKTDKSNLTAVNTTTVALAETNKDDATAKQNWHNVLLQMLRECKLLKVDYSDYANLNLKSNSILEIYIDLFLTETEKLLHEGLIKKYRKEEDNNFAMKGQLVFSKHLSQNLIHKERFYTRYTAYSRTNIFNQLLYKTLHLISGISNNYRLKEKVSRLLLDFPPVPDCNVFESTFDRLVFDRKTERYREALLISKMLLLNYSPDITGGNEKVIAILFDMNKLWEEFVFRRLLRAADESVKILRQQKKEFWWHAAKNYYKHVKPDILLNKAGKNIIIDTKWKIAEDANPGDEDLKQLFIYNLLWDAEHSFLIYPGKFSGTKGAYVHFELSAQKRKSNEEKHFNYCSLVFVNILDEGGRLDKNIGQQLLDILLTAQEE